MTTKKAKIPIVTEEIVDLFTKEPLVASELLCTRKEMMRDNHFLADLVGSYIATFPEESHGFATNAVVFAYHVLKKQEEYNSGITPQTNEQLN
jgi:hypothetical protein